VRIQPFGDNGRLLEELARFDAKAGNVTAKNIAALRAELPQRSAIHFVATTLTPEIEGQVRELLAAQKLVVLHLPAGARVTMDCAVHHYPLD
jgi:hypothetical protein